jgi:3-hydroxybutyryl-CoA dehydrogenase
MFHDAAMDQPETDRPDTPASPSLPPRVIGVVGLGTMGLGIAQVFAAAGFSVLATDAGAGARDTALARLDESLAPLVARGRMTEAARAKILSAITLLPGPQDMGSARLVIEAIVERLDAKQALFAALEAVVAPDAVLATNTSSLSVAAIAGAMRHPGRVLGLHFFNPAPAMKLVELVPHAGTDPAALHLARQWAEATGKTVVAAPDRPGFIVNRCARPFYGEALALLEEGVPADRIDAAMQAAGYRLGPFALIDLVGADINLAATESLRAAMDGHPRYHVFPALSDQVRRGNLGRKTGAGFLYPRSVPPAEDTAIRDRIEAMLVNEALWLLADGGTTRAGIDTALKLGLNFPAGPFEMLERMGAEKVAALLASLSAAAPAALAPRYAPAPGLI